MFDEDAVIACADLVGRTGASDFQIGYLRDQETEGHPVKSEDAGWYAYCTYGNQKLKVEEMRGPTEAADALARRILQGGQCQHCKKTVTLSSSKDGCKWTRMGSKWERGCLPGPRMTGFRGSGRSVPQ